MYKKSLKLPRNKGIFVISLIKNPSNEILKIPLMTH